jgi:putative ABC transport system permease protein
MLHFRLFWSAFIKDLPLKTISYLGLIISFSGLLVVLSFIKFETSYDRFLKDAPHIYRVTLDQENGLPDARMQWFPADWFKKNVPGISEIARFRQIRKCTIIQPNEVFTGEYMFFADSTFFKVFSFPLKRGNPNALAEPNAIVISEHLARKLFGSDDVLGKSVKLSYRELKDDRVYLVRGVMYDFPSNTHFKADGLVLMPKDETSFTYTYLKLNDKVSPLSIESKIDDVYKKNKITHLQPVTDIHLYSNKIRELEPNSSIWFIRILIAASLLLYLISIFNTCNIFWLSSLKGKKGWWIKNIQGALFVNLIAVEFYGYLLALLVIVCSGISIAFVAAGIFHVNFFYLSFGEIALFSLVFVFISLMGMGMPSIYGIIRNKLHPHTEPVNGLFKYLLIFQMVITIFLLSVTFVISRQMDFIAQNQLGAGEDNIIVLQNLSYKVMGRYESFRERLTHSPFIEDITSAMQTPGDGIKDATQCIKENNDTILLNLLVVEHNFPEFFKLKTLAGTLFPEYNYSYQWETKRLTDSTQAPSAYSDHLLVNKKALTLLGFKKADQAIGMRLKAFNPIVGIIPGGRIKGVIDDFHFGPLYEKELPLLIVQRKLLPSTVMIRCKGHDLPQALTVIKNEWKDLFPNSPFAYMTMTDVYEVIYHNERMTQLITGIIAMLGIIISLLGLIAVVAYFSNIRTKEIGIRKVNGAKIWEIMLMLNKDFAKWMLLSFIISYPISWLAMNRWLQNFAYKTDLSWWIFLSAGIIAMAIAILTVSWQSWQAATRNPVEALRNE